MRLLPSLCLALAVVPIDVVGQASDVQLASVLDGLVITQTTLPRLTLEVSNAGPNASPGVVVRSQGVVPLDQIVATSPTECIAASGGTALTWNVGLLEPGASSICVIALRALPTASAGPLRLGFRADGLNADPNSFNNTVSHLYSLSPFEISVDAAVAAGLFPPGPITSGASRRLVVQIRNNGPAIASFIKATSSPVPRGIVGGDPFILTPAPDSPCATFYEDLGLVTMVDVFPLAGLAGGASVDCLLDVRTSPSVSARLPVTFTASVAGIGVVDSNRSNDRSAVEIQVGFVPSAIPGPGWKLLLLLFVIMLASGAGVVRSRL